MNDQPLRHMNLKEALQALPHGPEFRFVDELESLEPGRAATGWYRLKPEAEFWKGHFPGQPLLPAVLMIEAIAQMAGVAAQSDPAIPPLPDLRLTAVRGVKIYGTAMPGEVLHLEAEVQGRMGPLIQAGGRVRVEGRLLAEGQVTLSGTLPPQA